MQNTLALFDLDNTLLAGDSDHAWGEFLIDKGLVDAAEHRRRNDEFYQDYLDARLDIHAYVRFTLEAIAGLKTDELAALHSEFMEQAIKPIILEQGRTLIQQHQQQGDCCVIITATNSFITRPIAAELGVDTLIATDLVTNGDGFSGEIAGVPCYQDGKVTRLEQWIASQDPDFELARSVFYSDSINDLPLLKKVGQPVAVDPDDRLADHARLSGWPIISLRENAAD